MDREEGDRELPVLISEEYGLVRSYGVGAYPRPYGIFTGK